VQSGSRPQVPSSRSARATGLGGADTPVSGFGRARERIAEAMAEISGEEISPFTLHDLRRSTATGLSAIGVAPHVTDRVLNHSSGQISGIARVYNRFEFLAERQAALTGWAQHIERLIRPALSNVVELPRRAEV
jgi:integrase